MYSTWVVLGVHNLPHFSEAGGGEFPQDATSAAMVVAGRWRKMLKSSTKDNNINDKLKAYSWLIVGSRPVLKLQEEVLALMEVKAPGISVTLLVGPKRWPDLSCLAREVKLCSHRFNLPGKP